jgi:hypothetical protein
MTVFADTYAHAVVSNYLDGFIGRLLTTEEVPNGVGGRPEYVARPYTGTFCNIVVSSVLCRRAAVLRHAVYEGDVHE